MPFFRHFNIKGLIFCMNWSGWKEIITSSTSQVSLSIFVCLCLSATLPFLSLPLSSLSLSHFVVRPGSSSLTPSAKPAPSVSPVFSKSRLVARCPAPSECIDKCFSSRALARRRKHSLSKLLRALAGPRVFSRHFQSIVHDLDSAFNYLVKEGNKC